ncbi:MAG: PIG-L family deacetylase [Proteobacteria bacterium]|nr:PIG-L family deacetylase [Pseudomonadota bacterium]
MRGFGLAGPGESLSVLCIGAHADDIEIGAGGTLLSWIAAGIRLHVRWCVFSATARRAAEATESARAFLDGASSADIRIKDFEDGFFPYQGSDIKPWMEEQKRGFTPDVVFTHRRDDAHQDHRELCQLSWNTFRDHLILEYEVPKWDGDFGQPNLYMPLEPAVLERKIGLLHTHFDSQQSKDWFDPEVFRGLARLRGMECRAPGRYAEGFVLRKASIG